MRSLCRTSRRCGLPFRPPRRASRQSHRTGCLLPASTPDRYLQHATSFRRGSQSHARLRAGTHHANRRTRTSAHTRTPGLARMHRRTHVAPTHNHRRLAHTCSRRHTHLASTAARRQRCRIARCLATDVCRRRFLLSERLQIGHVLGQLFGRHETLVVCVHGVLQHATRSRRYAQSVALTRPRM